jgi:glycosyltransferase involved in cell wall biosynthesis
VFNEREVLFFKSKDSNDLSEKLKFALAKPEEMKKFGLNCQAKVFTDYLWKNIAQSYAKIYNEVLR